jgi:hypothetical protein
MVDILAEASRFYMNNFIKLQLQNLKVTFQMEVCVQLIQPSNKSRLPNLTRLSISLAGLLAFRAWQHHVEIALVRQLSSPEILS